MAFVSVLFSLLFDRIIARRTEIILGRRRHRLVGYVTAVTVATQRPWQHMDLNSYFRDSIGSQVLRGA